MGRHRHFVGLVAAAYADVSDDPPFGHDGEAPAEDDQAISLHDAAHRRRRAPSGSSRPSGLPACPPYARTSSAIPGLRYDMLGHFFFSGGRMLPVGKNPRGPFPDTYGSEMLLRLMEGGKDRRIVILLLIFSVPDAFV